MEVNEKRLEELIKFAWRRGLVCDLTGCKDHFGGGCINCQIFNSLKFSQIVLKAWLKEGEEE